MNIPVASCCMDSRHCGRAAGAHSERARDYEFVARHEAANAPTPEPPVFGHRTDKLNRNDIKAQADGLLLGYRSALLRPDAQETLNKSKDE